MLLIDLQAEGEDEEMADVQDELSAPEAEEENGKKRKVRIF